MEKTVQPFEEERKQTDESLTVERGKTDESLQSGRGDVQGNTDQTISKSRNVADQDRIQRRNALDLKKVAVDGINHAPEDEAIEKERTNMDTLLQRERSEKEKLLDKALHQERKDTDKNLDHERLKTDSEVEKSAELLSAESAAHAETKSALNSHEEFLAIVSHDLKNPIGAIVSSAEILLDSDSASEISETSKTLIELIKRNAEISLRLISDILDMERIVEGKLQLQLSKNRIDDLIRESAESYAHVASAKKILLTTLPSNCSDYVLFDKDRIGQVLSNLIGNALKFTPSGGAVAIEAQDAEKEIIISVSDTGPGIPADQTDRIFERFAQTGRKQHGGLGLGLFISKKLIESHQGKLWVTSQVGLGSTFWFTLPK